MKQLKYLVTVVAVASLFTSCNSFLDTQNLTQATTANYPQTVDQAKQVLSGIYNTLSLWSANPHESFIYASQLASDDCLGGGGAQDYAMQAEDLLSIIVITNMLISGPIRIKEFIAPIWL